ncbi:UDP-GlcNAc:betaGal beta-1,3-N-acetylglucosaminyltransferase-like protein 1 isoform X8 [Felis catus]|uniref:UDP-GlcNAc:betaGal beta-1,3-N-acetylglucosaminyltransferase-like protein 1 isoform X8 n=1 Tax=Felis catus TaxID=9685 RepID=UPI001D19F86E|nr:UDP-GlcNAc:betaGal beta-1,3-N-acetylglucosaminyltransferase-like protein 1 isoform X8 [Felis catus]
MEVCAGLTVDMYVVSSDQRLGTELDDVMMPQRVRLQLEAAAQHPTSIVGCQVRRDPPNSTERYTRWINQLAPDQLLTQVFTSNGPTVIMPTWFCSRAWFSYVGPFDEGGQGEPEDLLFFYSHLRKGGGVIRVDQSLLLYRYHPNAATHSVLETTIWTHRVRFLEERALPHWATFTIWNAGRQGRRLYRSLTAGMRRKVVAFCDVDENKIRKGFYCHEDSQERPKPRVPILHFRAARPPFVICVKLVSVSRGWAPLMTAWLEQGPSCGIKTSDTWPGIQALGLGHLSGAVVSGRGW